MDTSATLLRKERLEAQIRLVTRFAFVLTMAARGNGSYKETENTVSPIQKLRVEKSRAPTRLNVMKKAMNKEDYSTKQRSPEALADVSAAVEPSRGAERAEKDNVEKIRDLIFGTQMRTYEQRFSRFEERLLKETADLREEIKRRTASVEAFLKGELAAIHDRQKADQAAAEEALKEAVRDWKESLRANEKRLALLEDQSGKAQRELRQQLLDESKRLSEEIEQRHRDLMAYVEKELDGLRESVVDRATLADLLSDAVLRLKAESKAADRR